MKLHITHGTLIDPQNKKNGLFDVVLENGKVAAILPSGSKVADAEVLDAKGCIVSPGFIDLHTHLREPGFEYKETIETGTRAAAVGGFTSICCMANTKPVNDQATVTEYILKQARAAGSVNVFPIGAVTKGLAGKELASIGELSQAGCVAFSDDGKCVENAQLMRLAMEYIKSFGKPVITHSIDPSLSAGGVMNEGETSMRLGVRGIPNAAEDTMIARDILLAGLTGARLHIAHISTAGGVALVREAKKKGLPVTCEVAPHHWTLTDKSVYGYNTHAKMAPPLRGEADRQAVIEGMQDGTIDAIATDHAPHAEVDKEVEFERASDGVVGLETALSLSLQLVENKYISIEKMVALLTSQPAQIMALSKGSLKEGADADVVVFDPKIPFTVDPSQFQSKSKNSPFAGMKLRGRVKWTIVGGKVVYPV
jgi:dihydroorotase